MARGKKKTMTTEEVVKQLAEVTEIVSNMSGVDENKIYDWGIEITDMKTLIQKYNEKELVLPFIQRSYIWDAKKRKELFNSIKTQFPFGVIIVGRYEGTDYIIDGLQRTTSSMLLRVEKQLKEEERKLVETYKVAVLKINNIESMEELKRAFIVYNSGIPLDKTSKEMSSISDEIGLAINEVSSVNDFFKNADTSPVFRKNQQHRTIAMNALLAASGIPMTDNKAHSLSVALEENKAIVIEHIEEAKDIIARLYRIYDDIDSKVAKRSINSNFLSILCRVIFDHTEFTNENVEELVKLIFADRTAIEEYKATTQQGGTDAAKCKERYDLLVSLLEGIAKGK